VNKTVLTWIAVIVPPLLVGGFELARLPLVAVLVVAALLAFGPVLVIRGFDPFLTWLVAILGAVYIVMFTLGEVIGHRLTFIGSAAFIAACAITALASYRRAGVSTLAGSVVLLIGGFLFLAQHLTALGAVAQLCIALGWAGVLFVLGRKPAVTH
jgi:hypothetical protein